jgi:hypothetical protein
VLQRGALHRLSRLAKARSDNGIVFRKDIVIHRKANPILYSYKEHAVLSALKELMTAAKDDAANSSGRSHLSSMRRATTGTANISSNGSVSGARLVIARSQPTRSNSSSSPEDLHETARGFFKKLKTENLGPCHDCPFIDLYWPLKKIKPRLPKYVE